MGRVIGGEGNLYGSKRGPLGSEIYSNAERGLVCGFTLNSVVCNS